MYRTVLTEVLSVRIVVNVVKFCAQATGQFPEPMKLRVQLEFPRRLQPVIECRHLRRKILQGTRSLGSLHAIDDRLPLFMQFENQCDFFVIQTFLND